MSDIEITASQRELARHALGLPNERSRSFRNRFVAGSGHPAHADWSAMVKSGNAFVDIKAKSCGGNDFFWLTVQGARAALLPGEQLCPEDFPVAIVAPPIAMPDEGKEHVLRKRNLFYRPGAKGYTAFLESAWKLTHKEAQEYATGCEGVTIHHVSEFVPAAATGGA